MDWFFEPWPWYISGPLIALVMLSLLFMGKTFGMSSNLRTLCSIGGAGRWAEFFRFDWKAQRWNLVVIGGAILGGFVAAEFMSDGGQVELNPATLGQLKSQGFETNGIGYLPEELFGPEAVFSVKGMVILIVGGLLVGFGTRYAGGCTSGHAISGLSNLQIPSLIAVIGFFLGGLIMTWGIWPYLF